jgi:hypothetical protein
MFVAGKLADAGWNIYFPRRDKGFDFIITKRIGEEFVVRPVQVKGKYPEAMEKKLYGYIGSLTELHEEMVLAIPFFAAPALEPEVEPLPLHVAYLPRTFLKSHAKGYRARPAKLSNGRPKPRPAYAWTFNAAGMKAMEGKDWARTPPPPDPSADAAAD